MEHKSSKNTDPKVMAAIPAFNEEHAIGSVITLAKPHVDIVVVIDDGSKDRTSKISERLGAHVIRHRTNEGKGRAIKDAFHIAQKNKMDILVLIDADGQHDPECIPALLEPIIEGEADIVVGSRFLDKNGTKEMPFKRKVGNKVLSVATAAGSGKNVKDSQSGYRAFSKKAFNNMNPIVNGFAIESEMLIEAGKHKLRIEEVPIECKYENLHAHTKGATSHGVTVLALILAMIRDRHPLLFFGIPGIILLLIGGIYGAQKLWIYTKYDEVYIGPLVFITFCILGGMFSLFTGLILNSIANLIYRAQTQSRNR